MATARTTLLGFADDDPFDDGTLARAASPCPGPICAMAARVERLRGLAGGGRGGGFGPASAFAAAVTPTCAAPGGRSATRDAVLDPWARAEAAREMDLGYGSLVIEIARSQLHVRETSSNRGTEVDAYTKSTGGGNGYAWCASFAYWCHHRAAERFGGFTTMPATFRAVFVWYDSKGVHGRYRPDAVRSGAVTPAAGDAFVMVRKASHRRTVLKDQRDRLLGHVGLVTGYDAGREVLLTIEGNTDDGGSAEGDGVYERERRLDDAKLVGIVRPMLGM